MANPAMEEVLRELEQEGLDPQRLRQAAAEVEAEIAKTPVLSASTPTPVPEAPYGLGDFASDALETVGGGLARAGEGIVDTVKYFGEGASRGIKEHPVMAASFVPGGALGAAGAGIAGKIKDDFSNLSPEEQQGMLTRGGMAAAGAAASTLIPGAGPVIMGMGAGGGNFLGGLINRGRGIEPESTGGKEAATQFVADTATGMIPGAAVKALGAGRGVLSKSLALLRRNPSTPLSALPAEEMASIKAGLDFAYREKLIRRSPEEILQSDTLRPDEVTAVNEVSQQAADPYSVGAQFDLPEGTGAPAYAKAQAMAKKAPDIYATQIQTNSGPFDPITGRFVGPPRQGQALSTQQLITDATEGQNSIIQAKRQVVADVDAMQQMYNQNTTDQAAYIRGIEFGAEVTPKIQELRELIKKRQKFDLTNPMARAMEDTIMSLERSMGRIETKTGTERFRPYGPSGSLEKGEILVSDANDLIEDINALRRVMKEFDPSTGGQMMAGAVSDVTGHGATLQALDGLHEALIVSMNEKAAEILQKAKSVQGYFPWSDRAASYDPDIIKRMNTSYGALRAVEDAAIPQEIATQAGRTPRRPDRLVGKVDDVKGTYGLSKSGVTTFAGDKVRAAYNSITGKPTPGLQNSLEMRARSTRPAENLRALSILRDKPIQIKPMPRQVESGLKDPLVTMQLAGKAVAYGLIPSEQAFATLSLPEKRNLYKTLSQIEPGSYEAAPYNFKSYFDGRIEDPMEKEQYLQMVMQQDLAPEKESMIVSGLMKDGTLIPYEELSKPAAPASVPTPGMGQISSTLDSLLGDSQPTGIGMSNDYANIKGESEAEEMVRSMKESRRNVNVTKSGL